MWLPGDEWHDECYFGGSNPEQTLMMDWTQVTVTWMNIVPSDDEETRNGLKVKSLFSCTLEHTKSLENDTHTGFSEKYIQIFVR